MSEHQLLVVDDVAENRALLRRYFGTRGFHVIEADKGETALGLIGRRKFDLILLDIVMPEMDGLEVLKRIRLTHTSQRLPVVMVSGKTASMDFALAMKLGANGYITKPIDLAGALNRIRGYLPGTPPDLSSMRHA
jgi:DNA-binding response OmpR family regulator